MAVSDFIFQGFMSRTHAVAVQRALQLKDLEHCILSAAFVNNGGVRLISDDIKKVAKKIVVYAGIRNDVTSRQGLESLLDLGVKLFVVDTGARRLLFHPKVYAARSKVDARVIIGSANFTAGGLHSNIEAGVALDLDLKSVDDFKLFQTIESEFRSLATKHPKNVIEITSAAQLKKMQDDGRLLDETEVEPPRSVSVSKSNGANDEVRRIKLLVAPLKRTIKKPPTPKAPIPKPAVEENAEILPSSSVGWEFVWESTALTRRDLTVPEEGRNTNPSGSINLDKGTLGSDVDHRHYFRDEVFQKLKWVPTSSKTVDESYANFQLLIKGVNYGEFKLRIGHTTSTDTKSYKQRNAMTRLSWGPIRKHIAKEQYIDRTVSLYRDSNDPQHFLIELD
jgi:HKD family nuclease